MRFDPLDPLFSSPSTDAAPATRLRRRPVDLAPPQSPLNYRPFPAWARLEPKAREEAPAVFFAAGASLALLDAILRQDPPFAGALRNRLALKAGAASARLLRLREDEAALRDGEHLAPAGAQPSPAGRLHRLFRLGATRLLRLNASTFSAAAELLELRRAGARVEGLAAAIHEIAVKAGSPLASAAGASRAAMTALAEAAPVEAEIFALWLADLTLAQGLGWERPVPLVATAILKPALRGRDGRRPRPGDSNWENALAAAYALAAPEAYGLAGELSRRADKLLAVAPKLRTKGAGRVVEILLADDAVAPARAARIALLSDRAARRLFDRLVELDAVREVSGRPSFRLYGL